MSLVSPKGRATPWATPWTPVPERSPVAKGFAKIGEDLAYYPERLTWMESRVHLGIHMLNQVPGLT